MFRNFKILLTVFVIIVLAVSAYAFAAANTVPDTKAGAGQGTVSGYTVSLIHYDLNATDPSTIDDVTFTLDAAADNVQIKLVSSGSTWYTCTDQGSNSWKCITTGVTVASVDQLDVVATSN